MGTGISTINNTYSVFSKAPEAVKKTANIGQIKSEKTTSVQERKESYYAKSSETFKPSDLSPTSFSFNPVKVKTDLGQRLLGSTESSKTDINPSKPLPVRRTEKINSEIFPESLKESIKHEFKESEQNQVIAKTTLGQRMEKLEKDEITKGFTESPGFEHTRTVDDVKTVQQSVSGGFEDGKFKGSMNSKNMVSAAEVHEFSSGTSLAYEEGTLTLGRTTGITKPDKDDSSKSNATEKTTNIGISREGHVTLGRDFKREQTNEDGSSKSTSYSAKANLSTGDIQGGITKEYKSANGKTTSIGATGGVTVSSRGLEGVSGSVSFKTGGYSTSISGNYKVTVAQPVQVNGKWTVEWKKELALGKEKGIGTTETPEGQPPKKVSVAVSGSLGYSGVTSGKEVFNTLEEAKAFYNKPTSLSSDIQKDSDKVKVGQSLSTSSSYSAGAGGTVKTGVFTVGAKFTVGSTLTINVTKSDTKSIELEVSNEKNRGLGLSVGGSGVTLSGNKTTSELKDFKIKIDTTTKEGKILFAKLASYPESTLENILYSIKQNKKSPCVELVEDTRSNTNVTDRALDILGALTVGNSTAKTATVSKTSDGHILERSQGKGTVGAGIDTVITGDHHDKKEISMTVDIVDKKFSSATLTMDIDSTDLFSASMGLAQATFSLSDLPKGTSERKWQVNYNLSNEQMNAIVKFVESGHSMAEYNSKASVVEVLALDKAIRSNHGNKQKQFEAITEYISKAKNEGVMTLLDTLKNIGFSLNQLDMNLTATKKGNNVEKLPIGSTDKNLVSRKIERYKASLAIPNSDKTGIKDKVNGNIAYYQEWINKMKSNEYPELPKAVKERIINQCRENISEFQKFSASIK